MGKRWTRGYLLAVYSRYHGAGSEEKSQILDEFCSSCGYNRKYAIRLLNTPLAALQQEAAGRRGRRPAYQLPEICRALQLLSIASNLVCSKRLKALIPLWLPHMPEVSAETRRLLESISPATIDRLLRPWRTSHGKLGLATTKPGSLLRKHIPVKTGQWDERRPGYVEADTVAHCGTSMAGMFVFTVNLVDIATGWSAFGAVWGRGQTGVYRVIEDVERSLPFPILGFDCDNGSEFLNHHLFDYFTKRRRPVDYTRSRPYQSNDNAHIEQKNWTHVRQYFGYLRFEDPQIVPLMNDLYRSELPLLINFFLPSFKLIDKQREGARVHKLHDAPKTPYQRLSESGGLSRAQFKRLSELNATLDPFQLHRSITTKVQKILALATPRSK